MYTLTVNHVSGHNQESFLNAALDIQQWLDSSLTSFDSNPSVTVKQNES